MWDKENILQQQALGIVGVNLIYGAFNYAHNPLELVPSLVDNIGTDRIEVDMLRVSGPAFAHIDNRLLSLRLVQHGLTNAVMFAPNGEVLQPSEVLHHKTVLVERGSFRPVTHVNVDMLNCATAQFMQEPMVKGKEMLVLMEITMNNLLASGDLDATDFLARVDMLGHTHLQLFGVLPARFLFPTLHQGDDRRRDGHQQPPRDLQREILRRPRGRHP
jgi:hypothetical protein